MVRTGSAILKFFNVLKNKQVFPGGNLQPCMAGFFVYILMIWEDITEKKPDSNNSF